jgi:hypothetical protein
MPRNQTLPTWLLLNACNFSSPSGFTDSRTGAAIYAGGLNLGDYFDLTEVEANRLSQTSVATLHSGRYRMDQVDSSATAAYVKTGAIGLMLAGGQPNMNLVTDLNHGIAGAHPVVFLNSITPGNYGFVQELGIANVLCGSSLTVSGSSGMGAMLTSTTNGVIECPTQSGNPTWATYLTRVGIALDPPMPGTKIRCALDFTVLQT